MTPQEKKVQRNNRIAYAIFTLAIAIFVIFRFGCNPPTPQPTFKRLDSISNVESYKLSQNKTLLSQAVKTDTIWRTKLVKLKGENILVFDTLYLLADDSCDTLLKIAQNRLDETICSYDSALTNKDTTIAITARIVGNYKTLHEVDSNRIVKLNDSISNHNCRKTKSWLKGFGVGFGTGVISGVLINDFR
jgi:hypothetical protein